MYRSSTPAPERPLIPILEEKRDEVAAICRKYGITRLELFGSAANGDFDPDRSDVDLLVEYGAAEPTPRYGPWAHSYVKEDLERVLGRKVDLVRLGNVSNPYVRRSIERKRRELLYAA